MHVIGKGQLILLSLAVLVASFIIDRRTTALVAICAPVTAVIADFISRSYRGGRRMALEGWLLLLVVPFSLDT